MPQGMTKGKNYKWFVLAMLVLMYIFTYAYAMTSLAALMTQISATLGLDLMSQAAVIGALPIGIMCTTFVAGILLDRLSVRVISGISILVCCAAIFSRGFMSGFSAFYAVMFLLGAGQGLVFPSTSKVISMWFGRREIFKANGILISGAPIGMIMGYNVSIPLSNAMGGWDNMYKLVGGIGIVFGIVWLIVMRDVPPEEQQLNKQMGIDTEKNSVLENLKGVLSLRQTWIIVIAEFFYQGFMQTVIAFGATVVATFPNVTAQSAALASSMGNLGSLFGYYILPPISEKVGLKKPFIWSSMIANAVIGLVGIMSNNILIYGICNFIAYFFNGWSVPGGRSMLMETPGVAGLRAGTAVGLLITMQRFGAALFPVLFAAVAAVTNMITSFSIIISMVFISAILYMFTKETGVNAKDKKKKEAVK